MGDFLTEHKKHAAALHLIKLLSLRDALRASKRFAEALDYKITANDVGVHLSELERTIAKLEAEALASTEAPAGATCADTGRNAEGDDICTDCFLPEGATSKHAERCDCRRCRPELYV
jgi:hypothetical protein